MGSDQESRAFEVYNNCESNKEYPNEGDGSDVLTICSLKSVNIQLMKLDLFIV